MNNPDRVFYTSVIAVILFVIFLVGITIWAIYLQNQACKAIGYAYHSNNYNGVATCADAQDNLHFVKMDCGSPFSCTAKDITVGNVRSVPVQ